MAVEYYFKVPDDLEDRPVIMLDPMLATANSAIAAVARIKEPARSTSRWSACSRRPRGWRRSGTRTGRAIYTAAIDSYLNDHGYIVPGLGDAGDRLYGTK